MIRVTFGGASLDGYAVDQPGASSRLLIPGPHEDVFTIPEWQGNEFLYEDGSRPVVRTLTPSLDEPNALTTHFDIVVAHSGALARWASAASPGDRAAISGPKKGYAVDPGAGSYLIAGDETALPAISQVLAAIPSGIETIVLIEVGAADAAPGMADHAGSTEWIVTESGSTPGSGLADAVTAIDVDESMRVWAAGEAASMQRIRVHLFRNLGLPRSIASVRGYWKHGRAAGGGNSA